MKYSLRNAWAHFRKINLVLNEFLSGSFYFFLGCGLLAASKLLQVVSFFLPIKVLILLSSDHVPSYVDYLPIKVSYESLLAFFVAMIPCMYIGYIVFGIFARNALDRDLNGWRETGRQFRNLGGDDNRFVKIHGHVSKLFSEVMLTGLSLFLIIFLDYTMFSFLVGLMLFNIVTFSQKVFYSQEQDRITWFNLHRRQFVEYLTSVNFIFVFLILAFQIKFFNSGVFEALFILVLSRMMFQSVQRFAFENMYVASHFRWKVLHK